MSYCGFYYPRNLRRRARHPVFRMRGTRFYGLSTPTSRSRPAWEARRFGATADSPRFSLRENSLSLPLAEGGRGTEGEGRGEGRGAPTLESLENSEIVSPRHVERARPFSPPLSPPFIPLAVGSKKKTAPLSFPWTCLSSGRSPSRAPNAPENASSEFRADCEVFN